MLLRTVGGMPFFLILLAGAAVWLHWDSPLQWPAAINAGLALWSNGVLANFAGNPMGAPSWAVGVSLLTTLVSVGLLVALLFV